MNKVFLAAKKRMLYNILMPYIREAQEENLVSLIHPENNREELFILPLNFSFPFQTHKYQQIEVRGRGRIDK